VLFLASAAFVSTPIETFAEQPSTEAAGDGFELSIDQSTISLKATNAPLKAILDQIGEDLNIKVDAQVGDDETVTDEFQGLLVDEAMRRLAPNYAIITGKSSGKITKIVIMPEGEAGQATPTEKKAAPMAGSNETSSGENKSTEPFKFEFDPSAFIQKSREEEQHRQ
jgi:hypothetical protein